MRLGLESSTEKSRILNHGAIIETSEEKLSSESILRVRLKDGTGWTTFVTSEGVKCLEELDAVSAAAVVITPEYQFLTAASAGDATEFHAVVAQHPTIITSQVHAQIA